jgi:hypothetical protein
MLEGYLIVNFEPAYIGFSAVKNEGYDSSLMRRYCNVEEIRTLLIELDVISPNQNWPPRELIFRLPVRIPVSLLEKMQLLPSSSLDLAS